MKQFIYIILSIISCYSYSQSGISINNNGTPPDSSAILDISSTTPPYQGILIPRMTTTNRNTINNPAEGLMIFNTSTNCLEMYLSGGWSTVSCPAACSPPSAPGAITGNTTPCENATGVVYSIADVSGATSYTWTAPSGATVVTGQGTTSITIDFGTNSGNICVTANNQCGSSNQACQAITLTTAPSAAPTEGTHTPSSTQIVWNWNSVSGATGYKWNTVNDYGTATDMGISTSKTETGLACNTAYTRYVWAYNSCGNTTATTINETTSACVAGKRVFKTSTSYTGNLGGIAGADNACQTRANAAGLGGTWKAWVSLSGNSPSTRFTQASVPYVLLNGSVIANNWADLTDGSINYVIDRDEFNNTGTGTTSVWSNTNANGTFNSASVGGCGGTICGGWTIGGSCNNPNCGQSGHTGFTDVCWTQCGAACCNTFYSLYCFEQ